MRWVRKTFPTVLFYWICSAISYPVGFVRRKREATAVIAKAASVLLYAIAVLYMIWVCGRVGVRLLVG